MAVGRRLTGARGQFRIALSRDGRQVERAWFVGDASQVHTAWPCAAALPRPDRTALPNMEQSVVVMGVAGCGKSSLGVALARAEGARLIEGDEHHSAANLAKMQRGIRSPMLTARAGSTRLPPNCCAHPSNVVLTCSALKRAYRERLRAASPGLRFVFMEIDPASARARIEARTDAHFFSPVAGRQPVRGARAADGRAGRAARRRARAACRSLQAEVIALAAQRRPA